jgi:hypothetical protein
MIQFGLLCLLLSFVEGQPSYSTSGFPAKQSFRVTIA